MVFIRFETTREDRMSRDYGPFDFAQLTYSALRVGPDGAFVADHVDRESNGADADEWAVASEHPAFADIEGTVWSDVVIFAR